MLYFCKRYTGSLKRNKPLFFKTKLHGVFKKTHLITRPSTFMRKQYFRTLLLYINYLNCNFFNFINADCFYYVTFMIINLGVYHPSFFYRYAVLK